MAKEIERKFLLARDGVRVGPDSEVHIKQGYICGGDPEVRVRREVARRRVPRYSLTVKGKTADMMVREETEIVLDREDAARLFMTARGRILQKIRRVYGRWEIDKYENECLSGLLIGEVELSSTDEELPPVPHGYRIVLEVTRNAFFKSQSLALWPEHDIRESLAGNLRDAVNF